VSPSFEAELSPLTMTILATYKCSAQCRECCFESSPHLTQRLSLEQIITRIDKAVAAFPLLTLICFSGGECFLIGDDLIAAIAHCTSLGVQTRCVTNGYWAASPERAHSRLSKLKAAGLCELNISTGDEHQQFVPFEVVVNGAIAAASLEIKTIIINEGSEQATFRRQNMVEHPRIVEYYRMFPESTSLQLLENVWMSFHEEHDISHTDEKYQSAPGCTNVLTNFVATPDGQMASCCGLTLEHIPELKLGDGDTSDFRQLHQSQLDDFLKVWLAVDGPRKILEFAAQKDPAIKELRKTAHICETCVQVYKTPSVAKVLAEHYEERVADVLARFHINRVVTRANRNADVQADAELVELRG
jgi:hypothetical protein